MASSSISNAQKAVVEKEKGNELFKAQDWIGAVGSYTRAMQLDPKNASFPLNRAMAYLKLEKFADAERDVTLSLSIQPGNVKALYRRGLARRAQGFLKLAVQDFKEAAELEPNNKSVQDELRVTQTRQVEFQSKIDEKAAKAERMRAVVNAEPIDVKPGKRTTLADAPQTSTSDDGFLREVSSRRLTGDEPPPIETRPRPPAPPSFAAAKAARDVRQAVARQSYKATPIQQPKAKIQAPTITPTPAGKSPPNSFEFVRTWRNSGDEADVRWNLLKSIPTDRYASLFETTLEPELVSEMLHTVGEALERSPSTSPDALAVLDGLRTVPRFEFIAMCLSEEEQRVVRKVLNGSDDAEGLRKSWMV